MESLKNSLIPIALTGLAATSGLLCWEQFHKSDKMDATQNTVNNPPATQVLGNAMYDLHVQFWLLVDEKRRGVKYSEGVK